MRLRRRERKREAPRGVRIVHGDGRVSECTLVRDPDDVNGRAQWIAVPPEGVEMDPRTDRLTVDYLPGKTAIGLHLPLARE